MNHILYLLIFIYLFFFLILLYFVFIFYFQFLCLRTGDRVPRDPPGLRHSGSQSLRHICLKIEVRTRRRHLLIPSCRRLGAYGGLPLCRRLFEPLCRRLGAYGGHPRGGQVGGAAPHKIEMKKNH